MALEHSTQGRSEAASRETNGQPTVVLPQAGDINTGKLRRRSSGRRTQEITWRMALVFLASVFGELVQ